MNKLPAHSVSAGASEKVSRLRQELKRLLDEHGAHCWQIADSGPMMRGSFYQVFKTCAYPGCRCHKGERHGPFPALSWTVGGKCRMVMVRAKDVARVEVAAASFKRFQKGMTRIRRCAKQIEHTLEAIRVLLLTVEYR